MGRACSTYRERRGAYSVLVGKPEREKPLDRCVDGKIILI
jgi:hypothetical protein